MSISTWSINWFGRDVPLPPGGVWILASGIWDDTGEWQDDQNWID